MAIEEFDISAFIEEAKAARAESVKERAAADKISAQKKSDSAAARLIQSQANLKFQFAENLNNSLLEFEGQLRALATKIARGDELTPTEEKDLARATKEYKKLSTNFNKTMAEGNKILSNMPKSFEKTKIDIQKDAANLDPVEEKAVFEVDTKAFNEDVAAAGKYIANLSTTGRRDLANNLNKVYGLKLSTDGEYSPVLIKAYLKALSDAFVESGNFARNIPLAEFLVTRGKDGSYRSADGGGETDRPRATISNKTQAAAIINSVVNSVFSREATPKEISRLTKDLNQAQRNNPLKTVKGITTGGLDSEQFLTDILKKSPEFAKRKTDVRGVNADTIRNTARSNFLELSDAEVNEYLNDLEKGQDIAVINKRIRTESVMGYPDSIKKMVIDGSNLETIYKPYKNRMAAILELAPETISINDATLRSAIGRDKEMPIYEFERALRKDKRWQYTDNARQTVSSGLAQVLKDFGFQG